MTSYILDAGVAAKWFVLSGESLVDEAKSLLREFNAGQVQLMVPDLFWPELANVLWKAVRQGRIPRPVAEESIQLALDYGFPTIGCRSFLKEALSFACTYQRSCYDSVYVSLAAATSRPLITADERLVNALSARFPVRWLGAL